MNTQQFIWFMCFVSAAMGSLFNTIRSNFIDSSVQLGQFIDIEPGVVIGAGSRVDSFAKIAQNTHIGANSRVGGYTNIGEACNIANNVNIESFVQLASGVVIGSQSILGGYNAISDGANIGNRVRLDQYSAVGNNARIGDDCILNKFSAVGNNAVLSSKAYVGQYSHVAPYVTVGELAVIHNFVETESGTNINPKQVVIRTPSSYDLYQSCALNVPTEKANIADRRANGVVSPEFNSMLRQMIETELTTLRSNCAQQSRSTMLPEIISLYLIQYHGLQRFNEINQQIGPMSGINTFSGNVYINGDIYINGNRINNSLLWQLQHEYHFGNDSPNNILEPDVKQKFIQLLAIDQDAQRYERVISDTFCKMLEEILSGERDVTCAKPILNGQTIISN